jgi:replication factor A1
MQVNPDIEECFILRGWYDSSGSEQTFQAHTAAGSSSTVGFNRSEMRSLDEVKQANYGMPDKPEYFSARATVMHIKADNISYPACPTPLCNKKVIEMGNSWRCEKCEQSFEAPEHRLVSLILPDWSLTSCFLQDTSCLSPLLITPGKRGFRVSMRSVWPSSTCQQTNF